MPGNGDGTVTLPVDGVYQQRRQATGAGSGRRPALPSRIEDDPLLLPTAPGWAPSHRVMPTINGYLDDQGVIDLHLVAATRRCSAPRSPSTGSARRTWCAVFGGGSDAFNPDAPGVGGERFEVARIGGEHGPVGFGDRADQRVDGGAQTSMSA